MRPKMSLVAAFICVILRAAAVWGAQPTERFQFLDSSKGPGLIAGAVPWSEAERQTVRDQLDKLIRTAPGLVSRLTAHRTLGMYRVRSGSTSLSRAKASPGNRMVFFDGYFTLKDESKLHGLIHESTHLADATLEIATGGEWIELARPRIEKTRNAMAAQGGKYFTSSMTGPARLEEMNRFQPLAAEIGLPTVYACESVSEALAECVTAVVEGGPVSPDIRAFVQRWFLATPYAVPTWRKPFDEAEAAFYAGQYDKVIALLTTQLQREPHRKQLLLLRGRAWDAKGDLRRAIDDYGEALKALRFDATQSYAVHEMRGLRCMRLRAYDDAIADFEAMASEDPRQTTADFLLAEAYRLKRDMPKAATAYTRVIERTPLDSPDRWRVIYSYAMRAGSHWARQDFDAALADLGSALKLDPMSAATLTLRGKLYLEGLKDAKRAEEDFSKVVELTPNDGSAYAARAKARRALGKLSEAEGDCTHALERLPNDTVILRDRAAIRGELGKTAEALGDYDALIMRTPNDKSLYSLRARLRLAAKDYHGAIADVNEAIKVSPLPMPEAIVIRGIAEVELGKNQPGLDDLRKARQLMPTLAAETDPYIAKAEAALEKQSKP